MIRKEQQKDFEQALDIAWKDYVDRGAATVDALEENTQELAFAKGFKAGYEQGYKDAVIKACGWLKKSTILADTTIERFRKAMEE